MKKILFLEGVDGAGKSTIARTVSWRLTESGIRSMVVNEGHPSEYGMLYKLDEKKGFRSSALARLSYRFSRKPTTKGILPGACMLRTFA